MFFKVYIMKIRQIRIFTRICQILEALNAAKNIVYLLLFGTIMLVKFANASDINFTFDTNNDKEQNLSHYVVTKGGDCYFSSNLIGTWQKCSVQLEKTDSFVGAVAIHNDSKAEFVLVSKLGKVFVSNDGKNYTLQNPIILKSGEKIISLSSIKNIKNNREIAIAISSKGTIVVYKDVIKKDMFSRGYNIDAIAADTVISSNGKTEAILLNTDHTSANFIEIDNNAMPLVPIRLNLAYNGTYYDNFSHNSNILNDNFITTLLTNSIASDILFFNSVSYNMASNDFNIYSKNDENPDVTIIKCPISALEEYHQFAVMPSQSNKVFVRKINPEKRDVEGIWGYVSIPNGGDFVRIYWIQHNEKTNEDEFIVFNDKNEYSIFSITYNDQGDVLPGVKGLRHGKLPEIMD